METVPAGARAGAAANHPASLDQAVSPIPASGHDAAHGVPLTGRPTVPAGVDAEFMAKLDTYSLETIVELKISRFLDQLGSYYPENFYELIIKKIEKPLINQILRRVGSNQVHAARILGINRNTLRKKMKLFGC